MPPSASSDGDEPRGHLLDAAPTLRRPRRNFDDLRRAHFLPRRIEMADQAARLRAFAPLRFNGNVSLGGKIAAVTGTILNVFGLTPS